jgi:processive 1,2-diacylglycerol beta-glucosyltransferase
MRIKHGLNPEATTMLVSAGGTGLSCMEQIITSLSHLAGNLQLVALCGGNVELKDRLESIIREQANDMTVPTHALGYTTEVDEFMSAADILIGKAGGLTTSEGLAKGLPLVIVNPIPGQEERNSDHLLEEGAAIRCNSLPVLPYKISQLLNDPLKMGIMRMRALTLGRPHASENIAKKVYQLAKSSGVECLIHPAEHKCTGFQLSQALNEITGADAQT